MHTVNASRENIFCFVTAMKLHDGRLGCWVRRRKGSWQKGIFSFGSEKPQQRLATPGMVEGSFLKVRLY